MLLIPEWMSSLVLLGDEREIIYKAEGELALILVPAGCVSLCHTIFLSLFSSPYCLFFPQLYSAPSF